MEQSLFWVLVILQITTEYELRCPVPSEWKHRAAADCTDSTIYICLFNEYFLLYSESCDEEYLSGWGRKRVRSPGIDETDCSSYRYQPFIFTTNGNSDCVFGKSLCSEEGQVISSNGTTTEDVGCRCDYTKGYTYTSTPENVCSCIPSKEDCSCYLKQCAHTEILTSDYRCMEKSLLYLSVCPVIRTATDNGMKDTPSFKDLFTDHTTRPKNYSTDCSVGIIIIVFICVVLQMILFLNVRPYIISAEVLYITDLITKTSDEPVTYTVMPGNDLTIEWKVKSMFPIKSLMCEKEGMEIKPIICRKDREPIKLYNDKYTLKWSDELTMLSLTINNFTSEDAGMYTCKVTNVVHLTNTCADSCLNILPHKRISSFRKSMQYFPLFRLDVINPIRLCLCSLPTHYKDIVVTKGQMASLKIENSQNITTAEWFRYENTTISILSSSEKYSGCTPTDPYLHIKSAGMEDAGRYVCRVKHVNNDILIHGYKLKVAPQEKIYKAMSDHRTDPLFVKTATVSNAFQCLQDFGLVVLIGREGTGKSKMCLELSSLCENIGYVPLEIDLSNVDPTEFGDFKLFYIIDNVRFDTHNTDQLRNTLPSLLSSKHGWIVITCRTSELVTSFKHALNEMDKFKEECLVNLDKSLTKDEKKTIIGVYLKSNNIVETSNKESNYYKAEIVSDETIQVKLDREAVQEIIKTEPFYGFPLTTVQFCRDRRNLRLGEKYFIDPPKALVDEIKKMYQMAKNDKNIIMINCYTVLVYLSTGEDLVVSMMDIDRYKKILSFFSNKLDANTSEIAVAANSIIGKYLIVEGGRYSFIHPYISKAVLLSSDYCVESFLIQDGPFNEIKEFVRSSFYKSVEGELVYRIERVPIYVSLFDRLFSDACKEIVPAIEIYSYMYNQFIKLHDKTFIQVLFKIVYDNVSPAVGIQAHNEVATASVQQISMLLHGLTDRGKDPYIYSHELMPGAVVPFGLIAACTHGYLLEDSKKGTFTLLLKKFQESFQQNLHIDKSLDINGNTFFHYLTLYSEEESCHILNTEGLLSKDTRDKFGKPNKIGVTPLEMAAFMGKTNVCKRFLVKTKYINKKKLHLLSLVKNGMSLYYGTAKATSEFDMTINFEEELRKLFKCGSKEDYFVLHDLFDQKRLIKEKI